MSNDDHFVSEIYQAQNSAKPSDELDRKILAAAREHMPVKPQWRKSNWRKWQWPASVAASVAFVSVILFTQYSNFVPNLESNDLTPTVKVDPFAVADYSTMDTQQQLNAQKLRRQQEAEILASRKPQEKKSMIDAEPFSSTTESLAQPELANVAEKEAATLAARALDDVELDILPFELEESAPIDTGLRPEEELVVTAARVASSKNEAAALKLYQPVSQTQMANSDYLDQLLVNHTEIKRQFDDRVERDGTDQDSAENGQLEAKLVEIQNTVFQHLNLLKLAEPNLKPQTRYLDMLSEQQRKSLMQEQINE